MAIVRGIHILAHGNRADAQGIAEDIRQHCRFLVGQNSWDGSGAYAWYENYIPENLRDWPQVIFEVDDIEIIPCITRSGIARNYFRIPGSIGDYVRIHRVIAFINVWEHAEGEDDGSINENAT